ANIIVWQRLFERHRRVVMAAAMIAVEGKVQKEGEVIHIVADRLEDESILLRSVGEKAFPHRTAPGDGAKGARPDPREPQRRLPPPAEGIRVRSRDFH
ncbi:MAG TPA: hypothetical protein VGX37_13750, partial [Allosphingosinicella sp.]|nr:hypothetical protein [Allosphingosinicella sp.]